MPKKTVICAHFNTTPKRLFDFNSDASELEKNTRTENMTKEVVINRNPKV